jgi:acyl-CoA synthetase (AMP-forming)/AMP-acid ligase II
MIVPDFLWQNELYRSNKTAVIQDDRSFSYGEVAKRTRQFASALRALGIATGDHVAVLSSNTAEHVEIVFAIVSIGAVWVPINTRLAVPEIEFIVSDSEALTVVYSDDLTEVVREVSRSTPGVKHWIGVGESANFGLSYDALLSQHADTRQPSAPTDDDLFTIMYTSGTTGRPKGVMLTHAAFYRGTVYSALALNARESDVKLASIPQFHAGGQIYQLCFIAVGATIVVLPKFVPSEVFRLVSRHKVTAGSFVPAMLMSILEAPGLAEADLSSLGNIIYGASPIAEDRLSLIMDLIPADYRQAYGQTECGILMTVLDPDDHRRGKADRPELLRSAGRAMVGYKVRIVDDSQRELPVGVVGEAAIHSDTLMRGYWKRQEATEKTLIDGWLLTGDLGWRDEDGYIYLVDRKSEMIISGGENVYPVEVENVLSSHPDVLDVAVFGMPNPKWGEAVTAAIVLRSTATLTESSAMEFCRGKLGGFKIQKVVKFVETLPRNASGKLQKNIIRKTFA